MIGTLTLALGLLTAAAQDPVVVTGRVVRVAAGDTVAAVAASVTLHRVGATEQGVVDSGRAGATGEFRLGARVDRTDVLLVSARWGGVEYFAQPVVRGVPVTVLVVDSSSTADVALAARHIIVGGPAPDGTRDVIDLVVLANRGTRTRVSATEARPTWQMLLPPEVANVVVGDADFAADAFDVHGDTLLLHAPVPPGERQFFLQYQVAPNTRQLAVPLSPRPDTLSVLTEEELPDMAPPLARVADEEIQGRRFQRHVGGAGLDSGLVLRLAGRQSVPGWLLPLLVLVVGAVLVLATRRALLPRPAP